MLLDISGANIYHVSFVDFRKGNSKVESSLMFTHVELLTAKISFYERWSTVHKYFSEKKRKDTAYL